MGKKSNKYFSAILFGSMIAFFIFFMDFMVTIYYEGFIDAIFFLRKSPWKAFFSLVPIAIVVMFAKYFQLLSIEKKESKNEDVK